MCGFEFLKFINLTINKNIFLLVLPLFDLDVNCVSLINQYSMGLSNPRTQAMFGILELYDYIMLFLLLILIIKMIFFINALRTSTQYVSAYDPYNHEKELEDFSSFFNKLGGTHKKDFERHKNYFVEYLDKLNIRELAVFFEELPQSSQTELFDDF